MVRPKIYLYGRHANRTPFSYPEYKVLFDRYVEYVNDINAADSVILGFSIDLNGLKDTYEKLLLKKPYLKFMVFSEEPLWDLMSVNDPLTNKSQWFFGDHELSFLSYNHFNSDIFNFDKVPYFLTTDSQYAARYLYHLTQRVNRFNEIELKKHWQSASVKIGFLQQRRLNENSIRPELQHLAQSSFRTELAELLSVDNVLVEGAGWGSVSSRQRKNDWHLDKLVKYSDRVALFSGIENTLNCSYITEKIFDAFAMGSWPIYIANPSHRVFEFADKGSFTNLYGLTTWESADCLRSWTPNSCDTDAYYHTLCRLKNLFSKPISLMEERLRLVQAIVQTFQQL
jgi:hypothetical protein